MENSFYKWKQLWEGVFHIQDLFSDYMYLVVGEEKAALIDTGMGFPGLRQLVERLTDKPVMVLNTHGHLDHIGGNDEFDCIYLHPDNLTVYVEHGMESYRSGVIRDMARELGVELSEEIMQALVCNRLKRQLVSENPEKLENNVSSVKVRRKPELIDSASIRDQGPLLLYFRLAASRSTRNPRPFFHMDDEGFQNISPEISYQKCQNSQEALWICQHP